MKLAVLGPVGYASTRPNVSLERIETESDNLIELEMVEISSWGRNTWRSGDSEVVTEPWGQPLPLAETLEIWIVTGSGTVPLPVPGRTKGLAATKAAPRRVMKESMMMGLRCCCV